MNFIIKKFKLYLAVFASYDFFCLFYIGIMKTLMRTALIVIIALVVGLSIYFIVPHLKPNNDAYAPQTPSSTVSPRLKGIFKGMGEGFSR